MAFIPQCSVDPGPDTPCPSASMVWVDAAQFQALPELTPGEIAELAAAFLGMFAIAAGIRFVLKQFGRS